MKTKTHKLNFTAIFVQDAKSNRYTAFFAQLPNIIAEGDNEQDAKENLFQLAEDVFKYQEKEEMKTKYKEANVKKLTFKLALSE